MFGINNTANHAIAVYKVARISNGARDDICLIRKVAPRRIELETAFDAHISEQVYLQTRNGAVHPGTVRASCNGSVEIQLRDPIDPHAFAGSEELPVMPAHPRSPRFRRNPDIRILLHDLSLSARLIDISLSGLCMQAPRGPTIHANQSIIVQIDGFAPKHARVRWNRNDILGIEFDTPLPLHTLQKWLGVNPINHDFD